LPYELVQSLLFVVRNAFIVILVLFEVELVEPAFDVKRALGGLFISEDKRVIVHELLLSEV
jgi:hypothetical protein